MAGDGERQRVIVIRTERPRAECPRVRGVREPSVHEGYPQQVEDGRLRSKLKRSDSTREFDIHVQALVDGKQEGKQREGEGKAHIREGRGWSAGGWAGVEGCGVCAHRCEFRELCDGIGDVLLPVEVESLLRKKETRTRKGGCGEQLKSRGIEVRS